MSNAQAGRSGHQHDFQRLSIEDTIKAFETDPEKGLDALVFTAGIGQNAPLVRAEVCEKLAWLGVTLDTAANGNIGPRITTADSRVPERVIPTNKEPMIARHTLALAPPMSA
jgi:acetate kinase